MKPIIFALWLIALSLLVGISYGQGVPEPSDDGIPGIDEPGDLDKLISAISKGATAQVMATDRVAMKFEKAIEAQTEQINAQFDKQGGKLDQVLAKLDQVLSDSAELRKMVESRLDDTEHEHPIASTIPEPREPDLPTVTPIVPTLPSPTPIDQQKVYAGYGIWLNPGESLQSINGVPVSSVQPATMQRATSEPVISPQIGSKSSTRWSRLPNGSNGNAIVNLDPHLHNAHQIGWDDLDDMSRYNKYWVHDYDHDAGWQPGRGTPPSSVFFNPSVQAATIPPPSGGGNSGGNGGGNCPNGKCPIGNLIHNRQTPILDRLFRR